MTTADKIYKVLDIYPSVEANALRYAVGMLNEIALYTKAQGSHGGNSTVAAEMHDTAIVALEGIKKRLTGEEKWNLKGISTSAGPTHPRREIRYA